MKKIYWIDDNINYISHYIQGIIKKLWGDQQEEGIASVIRIFGDGYKESDEESNWEEKDLAALKEEIRNSMAEHCLDIEAWNWGAGDDTYKEKEELIEESPILVNLEQEEIAKLIDEWKGLEKDEAFDWNQGDFDVNKIRQCFCIPEGASVAIDLVLLRGDKERVGNGIPIISMMFYDKLSKVGHECILYSTFRYDSLFIDKWKDIYNRHKTEEIPPVENIYAGRQMWEKVEDNKIIIKLKEIAKENNENTDKGDGLSKDECETEGA